HTPRDKAPDTWDLEGLRVSVGNQFGLDMTQLGIDLKEASFSELADKLEAAVRGAYEDKEKRFGPEYMRFQERMIMLQVLDMQWKDHLWSLDHLKEGIGLRGYGQRDPLIEYKKESFNMFESLRARMEEETIRYLYLFEPISREEQDARQREREEARRKAQREQNLVYSAGESGPVAPARREVAKVGRNDPCPCGSGKKFKKCHGA
ncbi:MAG: preprotein translocase subunit SecA, partial [Acidobacteria bacterium]|nr:preprotein translocase subunit SecA [Acidobacteriota bacterium]